MKMDVVAVNVLDDGGAMMIVDMDSDMLVAMAKIGLLKVLTDAAEQAIEGHTAGTLSDGV